MNVSTPGLVSWLRRAQLPESAVIYFATSGAAAVFIGIIAAVVGKESYLDLGIWTAGLFIGVIPHLVGIRTVAIAILSLVMIIAIALFPGQLSKVPMTVPSLSIPLFLYVIARLQVGTRLLGSVFLCLAGLTASLVWLVPMSLMFSKSEPPPQRLVVMVIFFLPTLASVMLARGTRRYNLGWLIPGDLRDSLFRIVGLFFAGLAGLGIASWVTVNLRGALLSTPLESVIPITGWFSGGLAALLVLWTVLKMPAAFSRGQMTGRLYPKAIAESIWFTIALGGFAIFFELSEKKFGPAVLIVLGMVIVYSTVRILMAAPLPLGQSPLWIVPLKPVDRRLRATVHKLAAEWKLGPTTLLAPPEAARMLGDAHLRACVRTRTLDRLFPLRSAHLADWDEGLPPVHAWNTLPLRELYANPKLWPEILAARLVPQASLIALGADDSGVLVRACTDAQRLSPDVDAEELQKIGSQPLQTGPELVERLREIQKSMNVRARHVLILHAAADVQAAWELRARLVGVHDASGAIVRPFVIPLMSSTPPVGCNAVLLGLTRSMLERKGESIGAGERLVRSLLQFSVRRPADEYDAVLIAPTKNLLSMDRPLSAWFVSRMYSDRAFARVIALRSPASGDDDVTFIPSIYSAEISWNSSPSLSARAADAAQKILASPVVKRESASAESASDQEQVAPQAAPDTVEEVQTVYTPRGFSSAELPHEDRLSYAAFAPLGNFMLTTSRDCTARLWNAENGQRRQVVFRHENTVTHADFDPHGRYLVTGGRDAAVKLWDVYTGQSLAVLLGHTAPVVHVAFNPRGSRFVSSGDLSARIWHVGSHSLVAQMRHEAQIVRAEFSPRAESLLTCSHDQTARLWDATTGLPIGEEMRHARAVNYATFSPDGNLVATASEDKTAVLWSAYAGHPVGKIFRHQAPIRRVAFSPDGSMLATASGDGTAALWNVSDGRRLATRQHGGAVNCVTFSPDGLRLATACVDGLVREWSLQDGQLLRELPVTDHAYYVAYNAKTTRLVAIDASTSGKLWAVE